MNPPTMPLRTPETPDDHPRRNHSLLRRILIAGAGAILIILGLIGWIIPIIPGFPLVFVGIPMVIAIHPAVDKAARRWGRRFLDWVRKEWYSRRRKPG